MTTTKCFKVQQGKEIVGAAIFGLPAGTGVIEKYSEKGKFKTVELRRFCLIDKLPKNSESRVLGVMFRLLRKEGYQRIISYADPAFGHDGTIYKATGFKLLGKTAKRKHIMWKGKKYPDRNVHQIQFPFHLELREALKTGKAHKVEVLGKFIYLKEL